jgi:predicted nucleic acid-binding protein
MEKRRAKMIIVDTNIIAYLHVNGKSTPLAIQLLEKDSTWVAPPLWESEFRNLLLNYIRHDLMKLEDGISLMEDALITMQNRDLAPSNTLTLTLAASSALSAYDCEFVALATELNCQLVTVDKQIIRTFPDTAISLEEAIK